MRCTPAFCGIIAEALRAGALGERGETRFYRGRTGSKKG